MIYTCPCISVPHANHVVTIGGKPICTWCHRIAKPVESDDVEIGYLDHLSIGTAGLVLDADDDAA